MKHPKALSRLFTLVALALITSIVSAQIVPVQNGQVLTLNITTTAQAVTAPRSDLLAVAKKLATALQPNYRLPIARIQLVNPKDGTIIASFSRSDWQ